MAKKIEMMSAEKQNEKVEKMLVDRAERLRTKCYPRPDKFEQEMKESEETYRQTVEQQAKMAYAKKICKAAGLPTEETTQQGDALRTGVWMSYGFRHGNGNDLVRIELHNGVDENDYIAAFEAYGHEVEVTELKTDGLFPGYARIRLMVKA